MKRLDIRRGSVCMVCGKPSGQRICEACRVRVEAEAVHRKLKAIKPEKQTD